MPAALPSNREIATGNKNLVTTEKVETVLPFVTVNRGGN
jgi:hypothetical protein